MKKELRYGRYILKVSYGDVKTADAAVEAKIKTDFIKGLLD